MKTIIANEIKSKKKKTLTNKKTQNFNNRVRQKEFYLSVHFSGLRVRTANSHVCHHLIISTRSYIILLLNAPNTQYWMLDAENICLPAAAKKQQKNKPIPRKVGFLFLFLAFCLRLSVSPVSNRLIAEHFKRLRGRVSSESCSSECFSLEEFCEVMVC